MNLTYKFGGGVSNSVIHPIILVAVVVTAILICSAPRKSLVVPVLLLAFLSPFGQQLYVAGQHFGVIRILALAGLVRLAILRKSGRVFPGGFNAIDRVVCAWAIARAVAFILLYSAEAGAVINQVAFLLDIFGGYSLLRFMIQNEEDVAKAAKVLAVIAVVIGACMVNEKLRRINIFGYLGSLAVQSAIRDGAIRAQGSFGHPVLAGVCAATLVPLFFWLWKNRVARVAALAGFAGSTMMVLASASSTPVMSYLGGILALCLWPIRNYMRVMRWTLLLTLLGLALIMKAPVWFIIAHVDVVSSSSGWHRAELVDTFVNHFSEWCLIGTNRNDTWGSEMVDTSNQFIAQGISGGLLGLVFFVTIVKRGFSRLGKSRRLVTDGRGQWFLWCLSAVMLAHVIAFWGTAYWDQTNFWWLAYLATISIATVQLQSARTKEPERPRAGSQEPPVEESPVEAKLLEVPSQSWWTSGHVIRPTLTR